MNFAEWLQSRLRVHGYAVRVDGDIGGEVKRNLVAFQRARALPQTGVADKATVEALRAAPAGGKASQVPAETMPPWMAEMHRRLGLHEMRDNAVLSTWLKLGRFLGNPAKLPWCGDAIETCIVKTLPFEAVPSNPFFAQAWAKFGRPAGGPVVGAIGVIRWNDSSGHVGVVAGFDKARQRVLLLGGNQSNAITLTWFDLGHFIAFRWPSTYELRTYPSLTTAGAAAGSAAGTR